MPRFGTSPALLLAAGLFCGLPWAQAASKPADPTMSGAQSALFEWSEEAGRTLHLRDKGLPVLSYNFGRMTHPDAPERKWRSGYFHPIYSVDGTTVLTDDFPADHYHHRGLFWAWPKILIEGVRHDLWQYDHAPIEQRFVRWLDRGANDSYATLAVENGWFVGERKVLVEEVRLQVRQRTTEGRAMTLELRLTPTDRPVTLGGADNKGYGGLSLRLAVKNEADCTITTPLGSEHKDLLETALAWAGISSKFPGQARPQGITLSAAPGHTAPAPAWMTRHYGCLMSCWPGTRDRTLQPGETVVLRYQLIVHEGNAGDLP